MTNEAVALRLEIVSCKGTLCRHFDGCKYSDVPVLLIFILPLGRIQRKRFAYKVVCVCIVPAWGIGALQIGNEHTPCVFYLGRTEYRLAVALVQCVSAPLGLLTAICQMPIQRHLSNAYLSNAYTCARDRQILRFSTCSTVLVNMPELRLIIHGRCLCQCARRRPQMCLHRIYLSIVLIFVVYRNGFCIV